MTFCFLTSAPESLGVREENKRSESRHSSGAAAEERPCVVLVVGTRSCNRAFHRESCLSSEELGGFFL